MILSIFRNEKYQVYLYWLFTISFILITFLPRSLDDTMFMDGLAYASIARNMAMGVGSFWRPHFADSFWLPYDNGAFFSGHPPLQFGIQSVLFRIFGDTTAVENIYNLIVLICSVALIVSIWRKLFEGHRALQSFAWLPVLCWYSMITVWYSIPNNFLDSTMTVFCLASCYCQLLFFASRDEYSAKINFLQVLAGIFIVLAFLTKGPVGLFPLAFSILYILGYQYTTLKKAAVNTFVMLVTFGITMGFILLYRPAYHFLSTYFNGQVVQALLQKREKTGVGWTAHFYLVQELFRNLIPHFLALAGLYTIAFFLKLRIKVSSEVARVSKFVFLIAFSGIAPMLISIKQYPHYLLPSLPFVAIFFASVYVEKINDFILSKREFSVGILLASILVSWGITVRKLNTLESNGMAYNIKKISGYVSRSSTVGVCQELYQNADIHTYFQRYHHLSLTTQTNYTKYIIANSFCLNQFDLKKDGLITLRDNFFLVIKNQRINRLNAGYHSLGMEIRGKAKQTGHL